MMFKRVILWGDQNIWLFVLSWSLSNKQSFLFIIFLPIINIFNTARLKKKKTYYIIQIYVFNLHQKYNIFIILIKPGKFKLEIIVIFITLFSNSVASLFLKSYYVLIIIPKQTSTWKVFCSIFFFNSLNFVLSVPKLCILPIPDYSTDL